jgi:putative nucleotidyltransferase with HDIG domain
VKAVEIKKILQLVWTAFGMGIISLLFIQFFIVTIPPFYFYSTFALLLFGNLPYTLLYRFFSIQTQKALFISNLIIIVSILFYIDPTIGHVVFYFTPIYAALFKKFYYFVYTFFMTVFSYLVVLYLHPTFSLDLVYAVIQLSIFLSYIMILYYVFREILHKENLDSMYTKTMSALILAIEAKDDYTRGHSNRVSVYSMILGEHLRNSGQTIDLDTLRVSSLLHDIGKVNIPLEILQKPGKLTVEEYEMIKLHSVYGADIAKKMEFPEPIVSSILHHHERADGKGYPHQLAGDKIPLYSKIIAIADTFDALTTNRSYRDPFTIEQAKHIILENSGTQFDSELIPHFIEVYPLFVAEAQKSVFYNKHEISNKNNII